MPETVESQKMNTLVHARLDYAREDTYGISEAVV